MGKYAAHDEIQLSPSPAGTPSPADLELLRQIGSGISVGDLSRLLSKDLDALSASVSILETQGWVTVTRKKAPPSKAAAPGPTLSIIDQLVKDDQHSELQAVPRAEREEILVLHERINELNHYELLQVETDATAEEIRNQFFALSRKYHPDRFHDRTIGPYRQILETVFDRLNQAYRILKQPDSRSEYDKTLPRETESEGPRKRSSPPNKKLASWLERIARADRHFKEAEKAAAAQQYVSAEGNIRLALSLQPDRPEFQEFLKRILPLTHKARADVLHKRADEYFGMNDREKAIEILTEALAQCPDHAPSKILYARVLCSRAKPGDLEKARPLAEQAVKATPTDVDGYSVLAEIYAGLGLTKEANEANRNVRRLMGSESMAEKIISKVQSLFSK